MFELPAKPQTIGKTLDAGFRLFFKSFKHIILFAVIFALVGLIPSLIYSPSDSWEGVQSLDDTFKLYGVIFVTQLFNNIFIIAMIWRIHSQTQGELCSIGDAFTVGLRRFIPLALLNILYMLAWVAGMLLFFIPGVFLSIAFIYSGIAMITENRGPIDSLGRSWDMVKNNWWRTMVLVSVAMMIYMVLFSVLALVFGITVSMSDPDSFVEFAIYIEFANAIIIMLVMPLLASIMITGFNDVVLRREGADLQNRIMDISPA